MLGTRILYCKRVGYCAHGFGGRVRFTSKRVSFCLVCIGGGKMVSHEVHKETSKAFFRPPIQSPILRAGNETTYSYLEQGLYAAVKTGKVFKGDSKRVRDKIER